MYIFENYYVDCIVKIFVSFLCGLILGIERKKRFHAVGMRTLILISVSSTVMCMLSTVIAEKYGVVRGDPTRIAAGVVTGIGFVGGGAIMHQGMNVKGLTSAAIIWTSCALGLACGIGAYFIVAVTLSLAIFSLVGIGIVESKLFPQEKSKSLTLEYNSDDIDLEAIKKVIADAGFIQRDMDMIESIEKEKIVLRFTVKTARNYNVADLTEKLKDTGKLKKISISEN